MFKLVLTCSGVPSHLGAQGANDITEEFKQRPWHQNVSCTWEGGLLRLEAENDFDSDGLALRDEFSDEICNCIVEGFDGDLNVVSVSEI